MSIRSVTQSFLSYEFKLADEPQGIVYVLGSTSKTKTQTEYRSLIESHAHEFQSAKLLESDKRFVHFIGRSGPVWILKNSEIEKKGSTTDYWMNLLMLGFGIMPVLFFLRVNH